MTTEEFSNEFDVLVQSYSTQIKMGDTDPIAFTEYEKSVFLTKSQEELIIQFYNGKNPYSDSFEKTEEIRRYLNDLVQTSILSRYSDEQALSEGFVKVSKNSFLFKLPENLWFITYESVALDDSNITCVGLDYIQVVPITQDEFHRVRNNPFRGASQKRVLRLDAGNNIVELISKYNIDKYIVRYLYKPKPIVVDDLPQNLSLNGINNRTECELNPALHRQILDRAVRLALISKSINADAEK